MISFLKLRRRSRALMLRFRSQLCGLHADRGKKFQQGHSIYGSEVLPRYNRRVLSSAGKCIGGAVKAGPSYRAACQGTGSKVRKTPED